MMNLPRPYPTAHKSIVEGLKSLNEPMMINGTKIYEPFYAFIWNCLKTQPLTAIRLKLSNDQAVSKAISSCVEVLNQSVVEIERTQSPKLSALQFRLIRIIYKKPLYKLVLQLKELLYSYNEKLVELDKARNTWKQTVNYTKRIHGDKALISKVRQNKAFEMRRKMNVDLYGEKKSPELKSKYEEREKESELTYLLAKEIADKMLQKC